MTLSFGVRSTIAVSAVLAAFVFASVVFAAVQLSVTQQRVKTLSASFTYQDVIAAPQFQGDPAQRLLEIVDIPVEAEILSAYYRVDTNFTDGPSAVLGVYDGESKEIDLISGSLVTGIHNVLVDSASVVPVSDHPTELKLLVSGQDLVNMTSGTGEIIVNYLEH